MGARSVIARFHGFMTKINSKANTYMPPAAKVIDLMCNLMYKVRARPYRARARKGVILCAGGFIFNKKLVQKHNAIYGECLPLGTYGDDGSGIRLGESVGGVTAHMECMTAWRFYVPPEALMQGVLVNKQGQRICSEDLYGAKQGDYIVAGGGNAYLIFDTNTYKEAVSTLWSQCAAFQKLTMIPMLRITRKKAGSLAKLAQKIKVPAQALEETMSNYNAIAASDQPDPMGKIQKRFVPQGTPPFYALDNSIKSKSGIPTAAMTLGGLVVDQQTGQVLRQDGSPIEGLYSAGRNAVGLCSNGYFASGVSIADCVFAGRRAGQHAATLPAASVAPEHTPVT